MLITESMLDSARTKNRGYTSAQINYAVKLLGIRKSLGWKKKFIGQRISKDEWVHFIELGSKGKRQALKKHRLRSKLINAVSITRTDYWRPEPRDIPKPKSRNHKNQGRNKARRQKLESVSEKEFYNSKDWLGLRARALEKYECKCMMCGRSTKEHGVVIDVSHIIPRHDRPDLQLDINNVQLLCEDCRLGKGSKYKTDWRPTN